MKCNTLSRYYVRDWSRPCGVEPVVFSSHDEADKPNQSEDPQVAVTVLEFNTELDAKRYLKEYVSEG